MDSTLAALVARYPRVEWQQEGDLYRGVCGSVHFRLWMEDGDEEAGLPVGSWWADAWRGGDAPADGVGGYPSPVRALDRLATMHPEYRAALHSAPVEPTRAEYIPPTPAQLATAQTPQSTPFPPLLLRGVWAALWPDLGWLLLVGAMALGCGALGMWWLTGGAR